MSSLFWSSHYEPQQTFPYSLWRLSTFLCLSMIPNTHSEQRELCTQGEKSTGSRREIHFRNDTCAKVVRWKTKILFLLNSKTKKVRFWLSLFPLLFLKLARLFPVRPQHVTQIFEVFFMNRWCPPLQKSSFKMKGIQSATPTLHNLKKSCDSGSPHHCCGPIRGSLYSLYNIEHRLGKKSKEISI